MQGEGFRQAFWSGALGSLGASGLGAIAGDFANSTGGTIAFGALSGGIGAELSGGNFWQGAVIGGIVAGLNHAMHKGGDNKGGKKTLKDLKESPPEYKAPKGGAKKVKNSNGRGSGWIDKDGRVWIPTDHRGTHAPHWDRQEPKGGGYTNVYPSSNSMSNNKFIPAAKVGLGLGLFYGGVKLLDTFLSRITPIFMTPVLMQQTVNPTYQSEPKYH